MQNNISNALEYTTSLVVAALLVGLATTAGCGVVDETTDTGPPDLPDYKQQQATGEDVSGEQWTYQTGLIDEQADAEGYRLALFEEDHDDVCSVDLVENPQPPANHRIDARNISLEPGRHEICTDCRDDTGEPQIDFVWGNDSYKGQNGYIEIEQVTDTQVTGRIVAVHDHSGTGGVINGDFEVTRCDGSS